MDRAFIDWVSGSPAPEAVIYREAAIGVDAALRRERKSRHAALTAWKALGCPGVIGPSEGAIAKMEASK